MALGVVLAWGAPAGAARPRRSLSEGKGGKNEVQLTNEEFKKLDRFEAHSLGKADKIYREGNYRQAGAEYETFLREYPRSIAIPYVLLRKARCLHKDDKRHMAIRQYNEVLDYFPNAVEYAAAALFYQGLAQWENGDEDLAMKTWARMARDKEYCKHRLAAGAINMLADNLVAKGQAESAVPYFWQIAVDFRTTNGQEARYALGKAMEYYVRTSPNEAKLRQLYVEARVLRGRKTDAGTLQESFDYWDSVRQLVVRYGRFKDQQAELRGPYFTYWAKQLDGKFPEADDYRLAVAGFHRAADGDVDNWVRRVDEQFRAGKQDDPDRIIQWIQAFASRKPKMQEYYSKLVFAKMSNAQIISLAKVLYDAVGDAKMARNAVGKLNLAKMPDGEKASLARYLWDKDFELGRDLCMSMQDTDRGRNELLLYYHGQRDAKNGIPLADHLIGVPEYATSALWKKAELLEWSKKYPQAIDVYRRIPDQPANLWRIADCYEKMGQTAKAIAQLREVEAFFKKYSAQAALRIGHVYKRANLSKECIAAYRHVLVKYPDTGESSDAHNRLEGMGVTRIRGGIGDAKDDLPK